MHKLLRVSEALVALNAPEVKVGDSIPELVIAAVDAEKMKTMAALLADPNTIHWDAEDVRRLGLGDQPVNQGPNNMGYVVNMLMSWAGGPASVRRLKVRFLGNVFAGDRLVASGVVTEVQQCPEGRITACDVLLCREGGEPVLRGTAEVLLPN